MTYRQMSDRSTEELSAIFEKVKKDRPVLVRLLLESNFESDEERDRCISGITFYIGSEILKNFQNPLCREAFEISWDICKIFILPEEDCL